MNEFDQKLFSALSDFRSLTVDTIQDGPRKIPRISGKKWLWGGYAK